MERIIPILPSIDADKQIEFYTKLGFTLKGKYTRGYFVLIFNEFEFHFYATKQLKPNENPTMCVINTDRLEELYDILTANFNGKIPRSGYPKITKIRELHEDNRFTITDPSGNTIFVIQDKVIDSLILLRDIDDTKYANDFAVLYDLIYSKEDMTIANNQLIRLLKIKDELSSINYAKLLIMQIEIAIKSNKPYDVTPIEKLISQNSKEESWIPIIDKYQSIISESKY